MSKPTVIIGGSGFIGSTFCRSNRFERHLATYRTTEIPGAIKFDLASDTGLEIDDLSRFEQAVVLAGITDMEFCARNPEEASLSNVQGLKRVLTQLVRAGVFPVLVSTDSVFDGTNGPYDELAAPQPCMEYGKQKAEVEKFLADTFENYLIVRLSKVYSTNPGDGKVLSQLASWIVERKKVSLAEDQFFSPIHVDDVVEAVALLLEKDVRGIYNIAGPERHSRVSLYDLMFKKLKMAGNFPYLASTCSIDDFGFSEPRQKDTSLIIDKLVKATGFIPRSVESASDELLNALLAH